jgi:hypothetical protein
MRGASVPPEWESLRLAAKAADRAKAADKLRPAFEARLTALGYTQRSIAHAFRLLTGGTVDEALEALERERDMARPPRSADGDLGG